MPLRPIDLNTFSYTLPETRIAKYPLPERDQSRLLVYQEGQIRHQHFFQLPDLLDARYTLFFNNTRVLPARIPLRKPTGAEIEVFLLEPLAPSPDPVETLAAGSPARWEAMIGNARKFKPETSLQRRLRLADGRELQLSVTRKADAEQKTVELAWQPAEVSLAEVLETVGQVPLPPYLGREAEDDDRNTYQTVYSEVEGAVAAPTAGLHFTDRVLEALQQKGIRQSYLTLHVGAGTFRPVQEKNALDHPMHRERMVLSRQNVLDFIEAEKIIPVGTTSLRTLESLYWYGVKLLQNPEAPFYLEKLEIYAEGAELPTRAEAGRAVLEKMEREGRSQMGGETEIMIVPGYHFRACDALITNFHQPRSTLILLVAALISEDWRTVYEEALQNEYRFLSYGDSSLLFGTSSDK